jgi:hypothetical protein
MRPAMRAGSAAAEEAVGRDRGEWRVEGGARGAADGVITKPEWRMPNQ